VTYISNRCQQYVDRDPLNKLRTLITSYHMSDHCTNRPGCAPLTSGRSITPGVCSGVISPSGESLYIYEHRTISQFHHSISNSSGRSFAVTRELLTGPRQVHQMH